MHIESQSPNYKLQHNAVLTSDRNDNVLRIVKYAQVFDCRKAYVVIMANSIASETYLCLRCAVCLDVDTERFAICLNRGDADAGLQPRQTLVGPRRAHCATCPAIARTHAFVVFVGDCVSGPERGGKKEVLHAAEEEDSRR